MAEMTREEIEALIAEMDNTEHEGEGCDCAWCMNAKAARALRQLLKEREWKPIESAPRDREILALSPAWEDGERPILLKWFKYNGLEAWRDWDGDLHYPSVYVLPPEPQSHIENRCQADTEQGEGKGSAAARLPSDQSGVGAEAIRSGDHVRHHPTGEDWVVAYVRGDRLAWCGWPEGEARLEDCKLIYRCTDEEHLTNLQNCRNAGGIRGHHAAKLLNQYASAQRQTEEAGTADDDAQRAERLPDTKFPPEAD